MLRLPAGQRILGAALCSRRSGLGSLSPGGMVLWKILRKILGGGGHTDIQTAVPLSCCGPGVEKSPGGWLYLVPWRGGRL